MRKYWKKTAFVLLVIIICLFYIGKRNQINNILNLNNTSVEVLESTFNFGEINVKDTLKHTFIVKNTSKKELIIKNVETDCECTITNFNKKSVKKNELTEISVTFIPLNKGKVEKNILFEANTVPPFTVLTLKGNVK